MEGKGIDIATEKWCVVEYDDKPYLDIIRISNRSIQPSGCYCQMIRQDLGQLMCPDLVTRAQLKFVFRVWKVLWFQ